MSEIRVLIPFMKLVEIQLDVLVWRGQKKESNRIDFVVLSKHYESRVCEKRGVRLTEHLYLLTFLQMFSLLR